MISNTDWQTLTLNYTPTITGQLNLRMQGKGGNAGGTGTEKLYWFYTISGFLRDYSRAAIATTLPLGVSELSTVYSDAELQDVIVDDNNYVELSETNFVGNYKIHQFKYHGENNTSNINIQTKVKAELAPSTNPVYLQIYNKTSELWETIDTEDSCAAEESFSLSAMISSNLSSYYDASNVVIARIYQDTQIQY
jgi:hypothetical protein